MEWYSIYKFKNKIIFVKVHVFTKDLLYKSLFF